MTSGRSRIPKEKTVLVLHSSTGASWQEVAAGVLGKAREYGWRVHTVEYMPDAKSIAELLAFWRPSGIMAECGTDEEGVFSPAAFGQVPVVYLAGDIGSLPVLALKVNHDSVGMGRIAARELLKCGNRSFAYYGFEKLHWSISRRDGFEAALKLNGCPLQSFLRPLYESSLHRGHENAYRDRLAGWLKSLPKPCGLLAANDTLAMEVMNLCAAMAVGVPEDIAVVGIDNTPACESASPTLSSINPNFETAGRMCAELLAVKTGDAPKRFGDRQLFFPAEGIVHRASSLRLKRSDSTVAHVLETIRIRACEGISAKDAIAGVGVPRRTVELHFRELTGHSILDEICAVRLRRVKELLSDPSVPIETIAARCGWKSTARLRVFFRREEGVSMSEWRTRRLARDI